MKRISLVLFIFLMANAHATKPLQLKQGLLSAQVEAVNYDNGDYNGSDGHGFSIDIDDQKSRFTYGFRFAFNNATTNGGFSGNMTGQCQGYPHQCSQNQMARKFKLKNKSMGVEAKYFLSRDIISFYVGAGIGFNRLRLQSQNKPNNGYNRYNIGPQSHTESYGSLAAVGGVLYNLDYHWKLKIEVRAVRNMGKHKETISRPIASVASKVSSGGLTSAGIGIAYHF